MEWVNTYGSYGEDRASFVIQDETGNLFTSGYFEKTVDFDTGFDVFEMTTSVGAAYILKTNSDGDFIWAIGFQKISSDGLIYIDEMAVDESGIYIVGGFKQSIDFDPGFSSFLLSSDGDEMDGFVAKYDLEGNLLWAHKIGGSLYDELSGVKIAEDGNIIITGSITGDNIDMDPSDEDEFLISTGGVFVGYVEKLNSDGEFIWAKHIESTTFSRYSNVLLDEDGNILTTGMFYQNADFDLGVDEYILTATATKQLFVQKLDADGAFIWAKTVQVDDATHSSYASATVMDEDGNMVIAGSYKGTVDFDFSDYDYPLTSNGGTDIFILKINESGVFLWVKGIGGTGLDASRGLAIDSSGDLFTCGIFQGNVDFDPSDEEDIFSTLGESDGFILNLDNDGNYKENMATENGTSVSYNFIMVGNVTNKLFVTGAFYGTVDIDPTETVIELISEGIEDEDDAFILKIDLVGVASIKDEGNELTFKAYPNPANTTLTIELPKNSENLILEILDYSGKTVYKNQIDGNRKDIHTNGFSNGLYTVVLTTAEGDRMIEKIAVIH